MLAGRYGPRQSRCFLHAQREYDYEHICFNNWKYLPDDRIFHILKKKIGPSETAPGFFEGREAPRQG